jgi:SNF2 family DNA or RNA helicase
MNLQTSLFEHQIPAVDKMMPSRVGALFMDMGTGKTRSAIELVYRRRARIDRVVWFCPVSLKETICYEIVKHTDAGPADICVFDDRTNQRNLPRAAFWYIVGLESISGSNRVTLAARDLITEQTMVVVDESSYIKGHRSRRTERITAMSERARYRLLLTGTPLSQGVVDLYAQMRFLSPAILGFKSFYSFAHNNQ